MTFIPKDRSKWVFASEGLNEEAPGLPSKAVNAEMVLLSSALAAYSFITEHPERAALYFMCGVSLGLLFTLCALVMHISCRTNCGSGCGHQSRAHHPVGRPRPSAGSSNASSSDWESSSDLSARRHRRFERSLHANVFASAEELERAHRLEERERIIREIWMNGQPEAATSGNLNLYY